MCVFSRARVCECACVHACVNICVIMGGFTHAHEGGCVCVCACVCTCV